MLQLELGGSRTAETEVEGQNCPSNSAGVIAAALDWRILFTGGVERSRLLGRVDHKLALRLPAVIAFTPSGMPRLKGSASPVVKV